ncbi:MAG: hypothetical protein FJX75_18955 [Armatimonadetes bacterium]|nr:hypothetical protein [Armatimonadota bacterium]
MHVLCTYCSRSKSHVAGEIPAASRYLGEHIVSVAAAALDLGIPYFILSGEYGLVAPETPVRDYDHLLLAEEVGPMVPRVAEQIGHLGIARVAYVTKPLADHPQLGPYCDLMLTACNRASVPCLVIETTFPAPGATGVRGHRRAPAGRSPSVGDEPFGAGPPIPGTNEKGLAWTGGEAPWREIMHMAEAARREMLTNRRKGESLFGDLLKHYPHDGMVYFKRGEAYEGLRDYPAAAADYEQAYTFFPMAEYKQRALAALERVARERQGDDQ